MTTIATPENRCCQSQQSQPQRDEPTPVDFARYPDLRIRAATPLPLLLAGDPPMAQALNVPDIAKGFSRLSECIPPCDAALAALYRFQELKGDRELLLLLNLLTRRHAETLGGTIPETIPEIIGETL